MSSLCLFPLLFDTLHLVSGLVASRHAGLEAALTRNRGQLWGKGNKIVKMAVWGLSATLGAAVFAVAQTALDWGPEVLLQLFWCGLLES